MNDTLDYFRTGPNIEAVITINWRFHWCITMMQDSFSFYDEVVHGKATILQKMNGDYDNKFPQARALYMYMWPTRAKSSTLWEMNLDSWRWDEKREQDWMLLDYPIHSGFAILWKISMKSTWPILPSGKKIIDGFGGLAATRNRPASMYWNGQQKEHLTAVFNFSDRSQTYELKLPRLSEDQRAS